MDLENRVRILAETIATASKTLKVKIGDLNALTTTEKSSIVLALNEVKAALTALNPAQINDSVTNTTTTWSGSKINTSINTAIANALEGEDLSELADQILALVQADNGLISAVAVQTFAAIEKARARTNIGAASQEDLATLTTNIGNTDRDFAGDFNAIYNS